MNKNLLGPLFNLLDIEESSLNQLTTKTKKI